MKVKANQQIFDEWILLGKHFQEMCADAAALVQNDMDIPTEDLISTMQEAQERLENLSTTFTVLVGKTVSKVMLG